MKNKLFYLDNTFFDNPDLSETARFFYKTFFPIFGFIFFVVAFYIVIKEKELTQVPMLLYIIMVIFLVFVQRIFYKKYGRRYLKCIDDNLILKTKYFKKSETIRWDSINTIQFNGQEFLVCTKNTTLNEIRFKAPLDRYLEIRESIREFADNYNIKLEM